MGVGVVIDNSLIVHQSKFRVAYKCLSVAYMSNRRQARWLVDV